MLPFRFQDCYAFLEDNTLTLGNSRIERTFVWRHGDLLPLTLTDKDAMWEAIYKLRVRGAPCIGIFAAYAMAVLAKAIDEPDFDGFYREYSCLSEYLNSSRPTAVNLGCMLKRMDGVVLAHRNEPRETLLDALIAEAKASIREQYPD